MIVKLFETTSTISIPMVMHVKDLLSSYNLLDKLIAYVKDEGGNLSTFTQAPSLVIRCALLALIVFWQTSCFGHAFRKACWCACNDTNVCVGFQEVSLMAT